MRTITREPWFAPKRVGWGWRPATWQGWLASLALVGLVIGDVALLGRTVAGWIGVAVLVGAWFLLLRLTGAGPGGPGL